MTTLTATLQLVRSRKLWHVVAVEAITDGAAEVRSLADTTLCGVLVRSEPWDAELSEATCPRCASRAAALVAGS